MPEQTAQGRIVETAREARGAERGPSMVVGDSKHRMRGGDFYGSLVPYGVVVPFTPAASISAASLLFCSLQAISASAQA